MNSTYTFRQMSSADIDTVFQIENIAHYHPWTKKLIAEGVETYKTLVMLKADVLVGYVFLKIVLTEAELLNITIDPSYHRQGLGSLLLEHAMQLAQVHHATECFLEVRQSNTPAYKLYEHYGFNETGKRPNYYPSPGGWEDALIMACYLA